MGNDDDGLGAAEDVALQLHGQIVPAGQVHHCDGLGGGF